MDPGTLLRLLQRRRGRRLLRQLPQLGDHCSKVGPVLGALWFMGAKKRWSAAGTACILHPTTHQPRQAGSHSRP